MNEEFGSDIITVTAVFYPNDYEINNFWAFHLTFQPNRDIL